jgi:hypothetical protein
MKGKRDINQYIDTHSAIYRYSFRCENPEYHGIWRNITEYAGISRHFPGIYRNITMFFVGSHATVYKHGRLTTYFITKLMDLSHFDGK